MPISEEERKRLEAMFGGLKTEQAGAYDALTRRLDEQLKSGQSGLAAGAASRGAPGSSIEYLSAIPNAQAQAYQQLAGARKAAGQEYLTNLQAGTISRADVAADNTQREMALREQARQQAMSEATASASGGGGGGRGGGGGGRRRGGGGYGGGGSSKPPNLANAEWAKLGEMLAMNPNMDISQFSPTDQLLIRASAEEYDAAQQGLQLDTNEAAHGKYWELRNMSPDRPGRLPQILRGLGLQYGDEAVEYIKNMEDPRRAPGYKAPRTTRSTAPKRPNFGGRAGSGINYIGGYTVPTPKLARAGVRGAKKAGGAIKRYLKKTSRQMSKRGR